MSTLSSAPLVLTCGDPAGIGPELTVKAWKDVGKDHLFAVIGDVAQFTKLGEETDVPVKTVNSLERLDREALNVIPAEFPNKPEPGKPSLANAAEVVSIIRKAVALVQTGQASAIVTNPISKDILISGCEFPYPGHTEFLADLDSKDNIVMMLASPILRVVPATIHIPLQKVSETLNRANLSDLIDTVHASLVRDFGIKAPRIAVAGLNPHAGENGQLGHEDRDLIAPVIEEKQKNGILIRGPLSADTMFHSRARKTYDVAICMYHDQALIPIKALDFDRGVNVTLGLSFVRTSPDHGTAFDIAGKGQADPQSLIEAIRLGRQMADRRANCA